MTAPSLALRAALAADARAAIEAHTTWDGPAEFVTLHWRDGALAGGSMVVILTDVHPRDFPALMTRAAAEQIAKHPDDLPVAYRFRGEMHGVAQPAPDAPAAERERFDRARRDRTFYQQPDAYEVVQVWTADTAGNLWAATRRRDHPGVISEAFYPAGGEWTPGGQIIDALLSLGEVTADVARAQVRGRRR